MQLRPYANNRYMSKAGYILDKHYIVHCNSTQRSGLVTRTRLSRSVCVDQMLAAPLIGLSLPADLSIRVGFALVTPEEVPVLERIENVTTSENRVRDEFFAAGQSVDTAFSQFLHYVRFLSEVWPSLATVRGDSLDERASPPLHHAKPPTLPEQPRSCETSNWKRSRFPPLEFRLRLSRGIS